MSQAVATMLAEPISQEDARAFARKAHQLAGYTQGLVTVAELALSALRSRGAAIEADVLAERLKKVLEKEKEAL